MTQTFDTDRRRHPVVRRAVPGSLIRELLDVVAPAYSGVAELEQRANEMIAHERAADTAPPPVTAADELTDKWLTTEVKRRQSVTDIELRIEILQGAAFQARSDAEQLIEDHAIELIELLANRLDALVDAVAVEVDALNGASTAAAAINAGVAEHWRSIADLRARYDSIRDAQRVLYQADRIYFDGSPYGDNQPGADPQARLYYYRRLDDIAPHWRGKTVNATSYPPEYPWPTDPVEQLVWFIRNDTEIWCPTPEQLRELTRPGIDEVPSRNALDRDRSEVRTIRSLRALVPNGF